jgi:hypothetical protein
MVRAVRLAVMPTSGGTIRTSSMRHISGRGNGSVLLDGGLGGAGGGSSYSSIDDYINTTNQNPFRNEPKSLGRGIESMNKKIENLLVKSKKSNPKKEKNINFNI